MRKGYCKSTRTVLCDKEDEEIECFMSQGGNSCGCGSNCYHLEFDGTHVYGVCNACHRDVYEVKPEYIEKYLAKGIWKKCEEEQEEATLSGLERLTMRVDGRLVLTKEFPSIHDTLEILMERLEIMEDLVYSAGKDSSSAASKVSVSVQAPPDVPTQNLSIEQALNNLPMYKTFILEHTHEDWLRQHVSNTFDVIASILNQQLKKAYKGEDDIHHSTEEP